MMDDRSYSTRYFARLTDAELCAWRPDKPYGFVRDDHVSKVRREMRRRSRRAGFTNVYDWLQEVMK